MSVNPVRTGFRRPWQNGVAERFVATVRRELLDHVIGLNDRHLRLLLAEFVAYYQVDRTHLALAKDAPVGRPVEPRPDPTAKVVGVPRVGGLHRRHAWRQAAQFADQERGPVLSPSRCHETAFSTRSARPTAVLGQGGCTSCSPSSEPE